MVRNTIPKGNSFLENKRLDKNSFLLPFDNSFLKNTDIPMNGNLCILILYLFLQLFFSIQLMNTSECSLIKNVLRTILLSSVKLFK